MGIKDSFMGASVLMKVCFLVLLVAQVCNYIAFTIPQWGKRYTAPVGDFFVGYGLWRLCSNSELPSACGQLDGTRLDWYAAVQAMSVFGFVGINVAFLVVTLQIFSSMCKGVSDLGFWNALCCFLTGACYLVAVIIFGTNFDDGFFSYVGGGILREGEFGFSFGFAIVALILEIVAGVLILLDGKGVTVTSPS
ncbi:uncharacterized protein LOC124258079 [Haliotis rubra]|uniref:uncharacterized protein LOC124258079 n=1 Tax=Haliotis rubra TaxID=36100 RepID=UPI001EE51BB3|nr:uncharacterized protein LOC124258079 [Haliotis rubra]